MVLNARVSNLPDDSSAKQELEVPSELRLFAMISLDNRRRLSAVVYVPLDFHNKEDTGATAKRKQH